ncbi:HNH endonuclease [Hydrogenophaga defluvii]|uniref:HNH endonuclease n=1 Tax=Hydrogenophaga defluvii TaxID=249410 RepID=A0ABW2SCA8_9BURK
MSPEQFMKNFNWSMETFLVARKTKFQCAYCNLFFFKDIDSWTQFNVDHLRPRKDGVRDERIANKVAACWTCNKLKSNFDPGGDDCIVSKLELIERAKSYIIEVRNRRSEKVVAMRNAMNQLND